ncbi:MAG: transglutaminase domain-containing protein [Rhodopirellula sp. JB044]|uniref:transglutaminase family protein n=1 Tax=Rhodopirellula sp. JB044 TaxID=3342844 RepID=UPI00370CA063
MSDGGKDDRSVSLTRNPVTRNPQRFVGALLVILQAVALGMFFKTPVFSCVVVLAVVYASLTKTRLVSARLALRIPITLVVMYAIQRTLTPISWVAGERSFLIPDAALIVEYLLVYQVLRFFVRSENDALPSFLPILAIVAVVFIGDVRVDPQGRAGYQVVALLLVVLSIAYFMAGRHFPVTGFPDSGGQLHFSRRFSRRHLVWLAAVGFVCAVVSFASASGLYRYARQIESTMNAFINPSMRRDSVGFSGNGRLGSVARQKGSQGKRVALRVYSDQQPGYLRGKAFGYYQQWQWQRRTKPVRVMPKTLATELPNGNEMTFVLDRFEAGAATEREIPDPSNESADRSPPKAQFDVWPDQSFREVMFTPLGVNQLRAPVDEVSIDAFRIVTADTMPPQTNYVVWRSGQGGVDSIDEPTISNEEWETLLEVPADLEPIVSQIAQRVAGEAVVTGDKIAAIEAYFLKNYEYQFGIDIPHGVDPVVHFLTERPPAHCEYFASGATLMLRSLGVPCRYVTGFVAVEKNHYGDYWVARNRDAHAWAEAYDPERGWVLVEATPASGVPQSTEVATASQMWDAIQAQWDQWVAAVRKQGAGGLLIATFALLVRPLALVGIALVVAIVAIKFYLGRRVMKRTTPVDPQVQAMQSLLNEMDRRWHREGVTREHHETMHQFANRIEQRGGDTELSGAAEWYRKYATIRYGGLISKESIESLREGLAEKARG